MGSLSSILLYVLAAMLLILSAGRFLGLPIFFSLVVSGSMAPSIQPMDLAVFRRGNYSIGDVVIWCSSPMYCVAHRVFNISFEKGFLVTKGDANPIPDQPVLLSSVRGVLILVVPRYIWIPLILLPLTLYVVTNYRRLFSGSLWAMTPIYMILLYSLGSSIYIFLIPPSPVIIEGLSIPSVEARGAWISNSSLTAELSFKNTSIVSIDSCIYYYGNSSNACSPQLLGDRLLIEIPRDVWRDMNRLGISRIDLRIVASLEWGAKLYSWNYTAFHSFEMLNISARDGVVRIYNPNPGCVDTNITAMMAERAGEPWRELRISRCLEPGEVVEIDLRGYGYAFIRIEYVLIGSKQIIQREVIRDHKPVS